MNTHANDNDDNDDNDDDADIIGGWIIVRSVLTPSRTKNNFFILFYIADMADIDQMP